jgi:sulfur carrier protein
VTVTVNGRARTVEPGITVAALLAALGLPESGVAVAVDGQVVPRSEHPTRALAPDARVEVLRAVGGG